MRRRLPDGRLYAECWHPDSPGTRLIVRPGLLRRLGLVRSEFATLGEVRGYYRDHDSTDSEGER